MIVTPQNRTYYHRSLPEVLMSFYNASELYQIYSQFVLPLKGLPLPEKRPVKQEMVDGFIAISEDSSLSQKFIEQFSPLFSSIVEKLLWVEHRNIQELEDELKCSIVDRNNSKRLREFPFLLKPEFSLFAIADDDPYSFYYRPYQKKEHFIVSLPPAIRLWIKAHFPKPPFYHWVPLTKKELETDCNLYDCSDGVITDLKASADFIIRGNVQKNKNGKFAKATVRNIASVTTGEEFFEEADIPSMRLLRHEILIDCLSQLSDENLKKLRESTDFMADFYASLLRALLVDPEIIIKTFIPHIKRRSNYYYSSESDTNFSKLLIGFIKTIPADTWISRENMQKRLYFHDINYAFFDSRDYKANVYQHHSPFSTTIDIKSNNMQELVFHPLLNSIIFHMASLGVVKIRYTFPPDHKNYKTRSTPFLSPFDGLHSFCLTPLGEFTLGLNKSFKFDTAPAFNKTKVLLDSKRLLAYCENPDPVTASVLKDFFETVSPSIFRATRKSIIGQAKSKKEISTAVENFRDRISTDVPANWNDFLDSLEKECALLSPLQNQLVFQLKDDLRIKKAFNQDPLLKKLVIKAEGWKIVVDRADFARVKARLLELGFVANF